MIIHKSFYWANPDSFSFVVGRRTVKRSQYAVPIETPFFSKVGNVKRHKKDILFKLSYINKDCTLGTCSYYPNFKILVVPNPQCRSAFPPLRIQTPSGIVNSIPECKLIVNTLPGKSDTICDLDAAEIFLDYNENAEDAINDLAYWGITKVFKKDKGRTISVSNFFSNIQKRGFCGWRGNIRVWYDPTDEYADDF